MHFIHFYRLLINLFFIKLTTASFYAYDKHVMELTQTTFRDFVFNKDHASIVEFYNSFCGACRRYSTTWKSFALDISSWSDVIKVAAVDCSENDELCRDYEIQYFPSIRYFSPYLKDDPEEKHIGQQSLAREISVTKALVVNYLQHEAITPKHWPDLMPVVNIAEPKDLFANVSDHVEYIVLVFPGNVNVHIGYELALDYHRTKEILIKQLNSTEIAMKFGINSPSTIHVIGRNLKIEPLPTEIYHNHKAIKRILEKYLNEHGITIEIEKNPDETEPLSRHNDNTLSDTENIILNKVKNMTHKVFQADLEKALKLSLTTEIYKNHDITGERFKALKNYVAVVQKYSPLGEKGELFFDELVNFINSFGDAIEVSSYKLKVDELEKGTEFFADTWVGCQGSAPNYRGYSCGLWTLYHYLTVRAAATNYSNDSDPVEVLTTIHDYTKYFFGCTECAKHFQQMAIDKSMWNVTSKNNAILWLWSVHNDVNDRLSGDATDDPVFPKIKFPSYAACPQCRAAFSWNENDVLAFLKDMHSDEKISLYGTTSIYEDVTPLSVRDVGINEIEPNIIVENLSSIVVIGFCFCLFIAVFMFIPKKQKDLVADVEITY